VVTYQSDHDSPPTTGVMPAKTWVVALFTSCWGCTCHWLTIYAWSDEVASGLLLCTVCQHWWCMCVHMAACDIVWHVYSTTSWDGYIHDRYCNIAYSIWSLMTRLLFAHKNLQFILNLFIEFVLFVTQYVWTTFVNSGESKIATINVKCLISTEFALWTCAWLDQVCICS